MDYSKLSDDELNKLVVQKASVVPEAPKPAADLSKLSDDELDKMVMQKSMQSHKTPKDLQAGIEAFGNALTANHLPQIQAATQPLFDWVGNKITGANVDSGTYVQRRDENIRRMAQQAKDSPSEVMYGNIGGTLVGGALVPFGAAAKGIGLAARLARGAATGAGLAALTNPGDQEGVVSPLQIGERLDNAKTGALIGGLAQGGVEAIGKGIGALGNLPATAKNFAEERAFKSLGGNKRDYIKAYGKDKVNEIGRLLIDEGIIQPGSSMDDVAEAVVGLKKSKGEKIGSLMGEISSIEKSTTGAEVSRSSIAAKSLKDSKVSYGVPGASKSNAVFSELAHDFNKGSKKLSVDQLIDLKDEVKNQINWDRLPGADIPKDEEYLRNLYSGISGALEKRAEDLANKGGLAEYVGAKKAYGSAANANEIAQKAKAGRASNRSFGLTDTMTGLTGAGLGFASGDSMEDKFKNAAIGLSAGVAHKGFRLYGNPLITKMADWVGNTLQRNPEILGQYAKPLIEAASKGQAAYNATLLNFLKDPKFIKAANLEDKGTANMSSETAASRRMQQMKK